jgi:hypothetical protein
MYDLAKSETRRFDALGYRIYRGAAGRGGRLPFSNYQETCAGRANDRCKSHAQAMAESRGDRVTTQHLILPLLRRNAAAVLTAKQPMRLSQSD